MDIEYETRKIRIYSNTDYNKIILFIHGGCFHDGDHTCNASQAKTYAEKLNAKVYVPDYPQDNINKTRKYLYTLCQSIKKIENKKIFVIGSSSGGFHALWLAMLQIVDCSICLCPVADPYARYKYLEENSLEKNKIMMKKQLGYFKSLNKMYDYSEEIKNMMIAIPTFIFYAPNDNNVPENVIMNFIKSQKFIISVKLISEGHETCYKNNDEVLEFLELLKKYIVVSDTNHHSPLVL
jgi:acetyl esterase/lipase